MSSRIIFSFFILLSIFVLLAQGDGACSASNPCPNNLCCSKFGYCGSSSAYCGDGCQAGPCLSSSSPTTTPKPSSSPSPSPSPSTSAPTTKPTSTPTVTVTPTSTPSTPSPTSTPAPSTLAPTSAPSSTSGSNNNNNNNNNVNNIKIGLNGGSSEWWFAVMVNGGGETTVKVELADSGSFSSFASLVDSGYAFVFSPSAALKTPISIRLTSSTGKQVLLTNIFSSFSTNDQLLDSGRVYSSLSSSSSTTSTPLPPTAAPTTRPTTAPTIPPPPSSAPTTRPTSSPSSTPPPTVTPTPSSTPKPTSTPSTPAPSNSWPNGPLKAIYVDAGINWDNPSQTFKAVVDSGYNYVVLAFLVSNTVWDAATAWASMPKDVKKATVDYIHSKNGRIVVSAGGATDFPFSLMTGNAYGAFAANWAKDQMLDGVDFDLENFGRGFTFGLMNTDTTIQWVADATNSARRILGEDGIISHAPQPPYFGDMYPYANGYGKLYKLAPSINFMMIQYYNNGPAQTYESIFTNGDGKTSVKEVAALGIPLNKIVVGKPVKSDDAETQYISATDFKNFVARAKTELGWTGGVMGWQWHDSTTNGNWIKTIYGN